MEEREIKFRAWDNKGKKWLLGYQYPNLGGFSMLGEVMLFEEWSGIINRFILQQKDRKPKDLILMQYTGLKDKKGKEIYEGDIVEFPPFNPDWCESDYLPRQRFTASLDNIRYWLKEEQFGFEGELLLSPEECEIIGNIYQNPELLTS